VTVLPADDHPVFRDGMARAIAERDGLDLVAEVGDGAEALREIERARLDVALLDIRMPGLGGREVLGAVRERGLST
jgi:two-component system nitrate/nitrite response regulator NarL